MRPAYGKVLLALIFLYFENNNFFDDFHDEIDKRGENVSDKNCVLFVLHSHLNTTLFFLC